MTKCERQNNSEPYLWLIDGQCLYFNKPQPENFKIEIMAKVLSRICRFSGHTKIWWDVAQHSILVANLAIQDECDKEIALHCLLHDGAENVMGDLNHELKYIPLIYEGYKPLEEKFTKVIARTYNFKYNKKTRRHVKYYDKKAELAEIRDLMNLSNLERSKINFDSVWNIPDLKKIALKPEKAASLFIRTYNKIMKMEK